MIGGRRSAAAEREGRQRASRGATASAGPSPAEPPPAARRRLPSSGPRDVGGFRASEPRRGPHGGSLAGGARRSAACLAGRGGRVLEPAAQAKRQTLHLEYFENNCSGSDVVLVYLWNSHHQPVFGRKIQSEHAHASELYQLLLTIPGLYNDAGISISDNLLIILKRKWWKYILLGVADVEANYLVVRAYQYTTLTSVQLLDCFGIPVLMALSWFILHARYRVIHFIAVSVCLLGVGTMVGADVLAGRQEDSGSDVLLGDVFVLLGSSLYAISNVCEEYVVKKLSRQEFLGMVGLFGTIISGIQLLIVEYNDIASIHWDWKIALLFVAFALCMFCLYSFMPLVIKATSATSVNLGILTADLYSLFFGLFLFGYKFSGLYILSFTVIMLGFVLYCSTPTRTAEPPESTVPAVTTIGIDNLGLKLEENFQETHSVAL
ncbi:solute carrier family 35 member F2 isoform X1 [Lemur catta]|uniref:solute carrier family 35 member F2 isoform X1 n=1 Tax=Lemur catta TaxID=9447 RepID=UPI001E268D32|nr:solute carrier family 35 member F2 isoform X1 [Lemur catta]